MLEHVTPLDVVMFSLALRLAAPVLVVFTIFSLVVKVGTKTVVAITFLLDAVLDVPTAQDVTILYLDAAVPLDVMQVIKY